MATIEELISMIMLCAFFHWVICLYPACWMVDERFKFSKASWFMRIVFIICLPEILLLSHVEKESEKFANWLMDKK